MTELAGPLLLVGCGKMGGALLHGWLRRGLAATDAFVVEPDAGIRERIRAQHGVHALAAAEALPADLQLRALVFAVKPQAMAGVLPAYRGLVGRGGVLLSIAAGTAIARFEAAFGQRHSDRARHAQHPCGDRPGRHGAVRQRSRQRRAKAALLGPDGGGRRGALDR